MKSNFKADLAKEKKLATLLDSYYEKHFVFYGFERVTNLKQQLKGIDLVLTHKKSQNTFFVDEKAQLDYVNETLPTFAFELCYDKNGVEKPGWLFDVSKKTHFYALITSIFSDEDGVFTSCNITFVNRRMLVAHLAGLGLTEEFFWHLTQKQGVAHGKIVLEQLNPKKEGYLFFSTKNKAEKPVNLILKLDYLIAVGVAKRLI
ncbi:hypothetical protein [Flagellimonas meishanensis]|uniref:hypothetical protein n=1 Tax=Flagellimonas meishanensis TaxID=2873264 RepID=UPI001CA7A5E7|nr:hypothetical protein [[Muricauda] meishanensis]